MPTLRTAGTASKPAGRSAPSGTAVAGGGARYVDPDGRERSKTFERKVDAERFLVTTAADLLKGGGAP